MKHIREIGVGRYGSVELVEDPSTQTQITVYTIGDGWVFRRDNADVDSFLRGIESLARLKHSCVLPIVGYSPPTAESHAQIGFAYTEGGTLADLLRERSELLDATGTAIIAAGIILGMKFLQSNQYFPLSLTPSDVHLDRQGFVRLAYFGGDRHLVEDMSIDHVSQPPKYSDMTDVLLGEASEDGAVYSFSLILYELLTGKPVFDPRLYQNLAVLSRKIERGIRPSLPESINVTVRKIIKQGWSMRADRPTFDEMFDQLVGINFKLTSDVDSARVTQFINTVEIPRPLSAWIKDFRCMKELAVLGDGKFGTVKLVEDPSTKKRIAVKFFKDEFFEDQSHNATEKFMKEVELLVTLQHPCILPIVGYSLPSRRSLAQIGMKFAVNGSLRSALEKRPSFMNDTGIALINVGLAHALWFLHKNKVIHRNLKPENILLDEKGWPLIGDLGSSRLGDLTMTQTLGVGSPVYMAPEMYEDDGDVEYTTAVDVFSFGLILYEVVVGKPVFYMDIGSMTLMQKVKSGERAEIPKSVPGPVKRLITWNWATDPDLRPSMREVIDGLERIDYKITANVDVGRVADFVAGMPK
jgi:serine/threonine protein kinase